MKKIYCISGLGADFRIFKNLSLPEGFSLTPIPWQEADEVDTTASYADKLSRQITDDDPVLIGVSFGGMMAIEISKLRHVKKIFIISSIKTSREKPRYFRIASTLKLNKIIPLKSTRILEPIENYNLGVRTPEEKALAHEYRRHYNQKFLDWSIDKIIHWQNNVYPGNLVHIHGSSDHIFPLKYIRPDYIIKKGGHIMVMSRAGEISGILRKELRNI